MGHSMTRRPRRMSTWTLASLALALMTFAAACSEGNDFATAPDPAELGFEDIAAGEIDGSGFLDDLSEEDKAAVREALQAARAEIRAIVARFRAGELTHEDARTEIQAVHEGLIETLGQFLTEEQIDRLLHHRPPHPDLGLSDEQKRAFHALREEFQAFVRDLRQQVHDGELTGREARHLVREKAHETRRAVCAILTPDQQATVPFCRGPE